jgi:hypothetical protein
VRFNIVAIQRRVIDPVTDTRVTNNPFRADGDVSVIPNAVLATDTNRLNIEQLGRASDFAKQHSQISAVGASAVLSSNLAISRFAVAELTPIPEPIKARALAEVDQALIKQGLLNEQGKVSDKIVAELSFERISSLPTPGMVVKGCLDECDICEPSLDRSIELDLERKQLENELLKKQIALLEKSQEYRCCPKDEDDDEKKTA